jgi:hypothetical protein
MDYTPFVLSFLALTSFADANPSFRGGSDPIFVTRLGDNPWIGNLRNPCQREELTNAANTDNPSHHHEILTVQGREHEIRAVAGNILARMRQLTGQVVSKLYMCMLLVSQCM